MLILTRRCDEEIVIDERIRVKVMRTSGSRVTIGVAAPPEIPILRCERLDGSVLDCEPLLVPESDAVAR